MSIHSSLLSMVVTTVFAVSPVLAQEKGKDKPEIQKGIEGLERQGKGDLGNENASKTLKELEPRDPGGAKPASGDSKPASGDGTGAKK